MKNTTSFLLTANDEIIHPFSDEGRKLAVFTLQEAFKMTHLISKVTLEN